MHFTIITRTQTLSVIISQVHRFNINFSKFVLIYTSKGRKQQKKIELFYFVTSKYFYIILIMIDSVKYRWSWFFSKHHEVMITFTFYVLNIWLDMTKPSNMNRSSTYLYIFNTYFTYLCPSKSTLHSLILKWYWKYIIKRPLNYNWRYKYLFILTFLNQIMTITMYRWIIKAICYTKNKVKVFPIKIVNDSRISVS